MALNTDVTTDADPDLYPPGSLWAAVLFAVVLVASWWLRR
jgi:hypothetical protein